jgi:hypothetical protein
MKIPYKLISLKEQIATIGDYEKKNKAMLCWFEALASYLRATDPRFRWLEDNLQIKDKETGRLLKWKLNPPQLIAYMAIKDFEEKGLPVRLVIDKARQGGISTLIEGILFHNCCILQGYSAYIVAHTAKGSDHIFRMSKRFYEYLPNKPATNYSNRKELLFAQPLESEMTIDVANKNRRSVDEIGRSKTVHGFHASEVSSWDNPEDVMGAVLNAISHTANTMVVLESTAKGASGYFHDMYWDAKNGTSDFRALFIGWHDDPRNRIAPPDGWEPSDEEKELAKKYFLDNAQLYWRAWTIKNKHNGDLMEFEQENPICDTESFKTSGGSVIPIEILKPLFDKTRPGLPCDIVFDSKESKLTLVHGKRGLLHVWKDPLPGRFYVIGADVAEGLEKGDFSAAYVLRLDDGDMCAAWHGKQDPDLFGETLANIGKHYNYAFIGVENNNHGLTTLVKLRDIYFNIYKEWIEDETMSKWTERLGWNTNIKTKRLLVDDLIMWIRDKQGNIYDEFLLKELTTFCRDEKGSCSAEGTAKDDRVMSYGIAVQMTQKAPFMKEYKRPPKRMSKEISV